MAHGLVVNDGGRVVDAVLIAQLVEILLVDQMVQQVAGDIGGDGVGGHLVFIAGGQLHIAVSAADDQHRLVRQLGAHLVHMLKEHLVLFVFRTGAVVDDGAEGAGEGVELAVGNGLDAVGLVKGPGYAVYVDIAAEEQRLKGEVGCHISQLLTNDFGARGKRELTGTPGGSPGRTGGRCRS